MKRNGVAKRSPAAERQIFRTCHSNKEGANHAGSASLLKNCSCVYPVAHQAIPIQHDPLIGELIASLSQPALLGTQRGIGGITALLVAYAHDEQLPLCEGNRFQRPEHSVLIYDRQSALHFLYCILCSHSANESSELSGFTAPPRGRYFRKQDSGATAITHPESCEFRDKQKADEIRHLAKSIPSFYRLTKTHNVGIM